MEIPGVVDPPSSIRCRRFAVVDPMSSIRFRRFAFVNPVSLIRNLAGHLLTTPHPQSRHTKKIAGINPAIDRFDIGRAEHQ
ncbi:hypothetical protein RBI22_12010 [Alcaligenaceae bacterium C4P045]|nr:hypothetical protein [Alcaligenaceae bacterium C4P045]